MLSEKLYQIKELMELFGIGRDVIRYYERIGLITSIRKENGYRVFDEFNVLKLRKILYFRIMGITVEEIILYFESSSLSERMDVLRGVRQRTEQEILALNEKLRKIRILESVARDNILFSDGFNLGSDLSLCIDCPYIANREDAIFYNNVGFITQYTPQHGLGEIQHCNFILGAHMLCSHCTGCDKRIYFKEYYRARIGFQSEAQIRQIICGQIKDLQQLNAQAIKTVYAVKQSVKTDDGLQIILDIFLPFDE